MCQGGDQAAAVTGREKLQTEIQQRMILMLICLLLCHFHLSLLAIKLIYLAYYPVTLSLPFNFGDDNLKQEGVVQNFWCSVFSFGT